MTTLASVGGEPDPTLLEELRMGSWRFGAGEHVAIPLGRAATVDDLRLHAYRANNPGQAAVYRRGETADAEPAVPGWRFAVDDLLR